MSLPFDYFDVLERHGNGTSQKGPLGYSATVNFFWNLRKSGEIMASGSGNNEVPSPLCREIDFFLAELLIFRVFNFK